MSQVQHFICVHGHFYQPPRENPWLEAIQIQESAAPYHDWNARINHECYAANGSSRILNGGGRILRIVNNYSRISFNFGPTLLAWMETHAPLSYARILDADRASQQRFGGHGSAIAQVYNHVILPLASTEDRITQIRWGIADFEHRFQRKPEGMWLAETAVDLESLDLLAQHGIRFTILAPSQCARVRPIPSEDDPEAPGWHETPHASVDPTQPYLVRTREGRSIAVFFYDGPISRAIAFEGLLNNGREMAARLLRGFRDNGRPGQLVHIATDGESYGHHHRHGDMALAYALQWIEENSRATLTNYGQFLEMFPPAYQAEVFDDTSWSCSHGVERWRSHCGCNSGSPGWTQQWRAPLRSALDWLRDSVRPLWREAGAAILSDVTAARDAYVNVILDSSRTAQQQFLERFSGANANPAGEVRVLKLMELERHIQLMYTSCAWFFDDLAGIETVQIISYAARVLQLASELFGAEGAALETQFLTLLGEAHSNGPGKPSGADIYRQSVLPQRVGIEQAVAQYAIVSLFEPQPEIASLYCYEVRRKAAEVLSSGRSRFALGQAEVCSRITREAAVFDFTVVHLGDQNLSAAVRRSGATLDNAAFDSFAAKTRDAVSRSDLPALMRLLVRDFGWAGYSLNSLFRDDQQRILKVLLESTLNDMEATLRTIYEDHASLLRYLSLSGMPRPQSLMLAAEFTLNSDLRHALASQPFDASRTREVLARVSADSVSLDAATLGYLASERMLRAILRVAEKKDQESLTEAIEILNVVEELPFPVDLWEPQNRWYRMMRDNQAPAGEHWHEKFLELGTKLNLDVEHLTADL